MANKSNKRKRKVNRVFHGNRHTNKVKTVLSEQQQPNEDIDGTSDRENNVENGTPCTSSTKLNISFDQPVIKHDDFFFFFHI